MKRARHRIVLDVRCARCRGITWLEGLEHERECRSVQAHLRCRKCNGRSAVVIPCTALVMQMTDLDETIEV